MNELQRFASNYWLERYKLAERWKETDRDEAARQLQELYQHTQESIEREINNFYAKYARENNISIAEAKKRAEQMDVIAFQNKARHYVRTRDFSQRANEELALYNLELKVSRLELLSYNIDLELVALANDEEHMVRELKKQAYQHEVADQAHIFSFSVATEQDLRGYSETVINKPYHGAGFSERIWERVDDLRSYLAKEIPEAIVKGESPIKVAQRLRKEFDVTTYEAERLAVTEIGMMYTEAQKHSYEEADFHYYDIIPEAGACDMCQAYADEGPHKVEDMIVGMNAPMFHPHCRCGTAPSAKYERMKLEAMFEELGL